MPRPGTTPGDVLRARPADPRHPRRGDFRRRARHDDERPRKVDPRTGEYIDYDYGDFQPWLTYYVVGADGQAQAPARIDLPGPRLPHDTTFTPSYTILHDFPLFHDVNVLKRTGHRVVQFHRECRRASA